MGSNDTVIYGDFNGEMHEENTRSGRKTHWDSKLVINSFGDTVSIGIVPVDEDESTNEFAVYDADRAQFITLSRGGAQRAIRALREARDKVFGADE